MKSQKFILWDELKRDNAIAFINELPLDGKAMITIGPAKGKRSEAINRLMWLWYGIIQKHLRDHMGQTYSTDDIHEYMVNLLLPKKAIVINGITKEIRRPTSKMNNKEMSMYLETLDHYCGSDLGLSLPHPVDLYLQAFNK